MEVVDSVSGAALEMDFITCETVEEASSFRADAEELSCAADDDAGATIESRAIDEADGTIVSTTTEEPTDARLDAVEASLSVIDDPAAETAGMDSGTEAANEEITAVGRVSLSDEKSFEIAARFVDGETVRRDSDSETTSGRTADVDPTTASEASGTGLDPVWIAEEMTDDSEADALKADELNAPRACVKGVVSPLPSSLTRSQIFFKCGSTNCRLCSPSMCTRWTSSACSLCNKGTAYGFAI